MSGKYSNIRRTPTFIAAYSALRANLAKTSPLAFSALPGAMTKILDAISRYPRSWPLKRKRLGTAKPEFHVAIVDIAYRRLHVRYYVDADDLSYLSAVWVDGQDEPQYVID